MKSPEEQIRRRAKAQAVNPDDPFVRKQVEAALNLGKRDRFAVGGCLSRNE